jgi:hypothetical protein
MVLKDIIGPSLVLDAKEISNVDDCYSAVGGRDAGRFIFGNEQRALDGAIFGVLAVDHLECDDAVGAGVVCQ